MTEEAVIVWEGSDQLREVLRPVDELRQHPENPWRGNVEEIAGSLERFGQVRPVLVSDDGTIIGGNHTWAAAKSLGWTHIAAIPNTFESEDAARAYLLADNRLAELGDYDRAELVALLAELEAASAWPGTGYQPRDLDDLRRLEELASAPLPPIPEPAVAPASGPPVDFKEVLLMLSEAQAEQFAIYVRILRKEHSTEGVTETVMAAVLSEASRGVPEAVQ